MKKSKKDNTMTNASSASIIHNYTAEVAWETKRKIAETVTTAFMNKIESEDCQGKSKIILADLCTHILDSLAEQFKRPDQTDAATVHDLAFAS